MANLTFFYGTMEAGKTSKLFQDNYNYRKHNLKTVVVKPGKDTKGGETLVNRKGESIEVDIILAEDASFLSSENLRKIDYAKFILADEAQFFTKEQISELWYIAHFMDINVIAYGLKNNFKGEAFEGSAELFSRADQKHELTVNCMCGEPAMFNARRVNGEFINEGEEVVIDGEHDHIEYVPLCGDCFLKKVVLKENPYLSRMRTSHLK